MRLIDANELKKYIIPPRANGKSLITELIDSMPTIEIEPVKHGKWVIEDGHVCCSECGEISKEFNYCPYCGARRDEE